MNERNITARKLSQDTGISTGNISDWKSGRSKPSTEKLSMLAEYFNVSTDYLLGKTDIKNKPTTDNSDELSPDEAEFMAIFRQLSPEHKRELMDYALYKADK